VAVACIATLLSVWLLARSGLWPRVKGIARPVVVVALLMGLFIATGGWAYTYGDAPGLTLRLEAPSGSFPEGPYSSVGMVLNYSFFNGGGEPVRFDPGPADCCLGEPGMPPLLRLYDANGTILTSHLMVGSLRPEPFGGHPERFIELGAGESWRGTVYWPPLHSIPEPVLDAGNYTAHLFWSSSRCNYSGLPCFLGALQSNDVGIRVV
jgi:hypothetical protein